MNANEGYIARAIHAGARGFIDKSASPQELFDAIRQVARQGVYLHPTVRGKTERAVQSNEAPESALSDRELQVLIQLAQGSTSREVSVSLNLSLSTIETYRSRVLEKLHLRNNSDITRFAIRRGLTDIG